MTKSRRWSNASAPCRLEWRPSRVLATALAVLGLLAAIAVIASELPWVVSVPLALAAFLYGIRLARRELLRPACSLVIPMGEGAATMDGQPVRNLQLRWRGPLAFLQWRDADGRRRYLQGWPDNLDPDARRELRLAVATRVPARPSRSVAP